MEKKCEKCDSYDICGEILRRKCGSEKIHYAPCVLDLEIKIEELQQQVKEYEAAIEKAIYDLHYEDWKTQAEFLKATVSKYKGEFMKDLIVKILQDNKKDLEGYDYLGTNFGVSEDDFDKVAQEIVYALINEISK
jgi:hypothetical protein